MKTQKFLIWLLIPIVILIVTISPIFSQTPVTITMLMQALEVAQWQPLVEEFEKQHPDINLEIIEAPNASNQVEDLYTSSFLLGNSPYDIVYMDIVWTPKFAAAGWLKPLSDYVSQAELEPFLAEDINGGMYEGELYRMPFRSDAGMLYYRTDLLEKVDRIPPNTVNELMEISQQLQQENLTDWGYVWQGKQYEGLSAMFVEILAGFGGYWINPDTLEVGLAQPEAIEAVKFLQSTINENVSPEGVTTYAEEETRRLFQSGRVAFLRNWPYVYSLASQDDSPIQGKFAIKPMVHSQGYESGACLGGWGLGISATTKHPDEAWEVIKFASSRASQKTFILNTGYVPSRKSLFNDPEIVAKYPHYPDLLKVVEKTTLRPPIAQYSQASDILQRYLSAALTNRLSPQQAMEAATRETRQLLN